MRRTSRLVLLIPLLRLALRLFRQGGRRRGRW
jgi:hypothetical protein